MNFINRSEELSILRHHSKHADFLVLFGRRRVGKTALIQKWSEDERVAYSQAIEASPSIQISQIVQDFEAFLPKGIRAPETWPELLATLSLIKENLVVVLDEFPYLVKSDPSLPSQVQRWIDHGRPKTMGLVLLGSSQHMMHSLFLDGSSPLYGRADRILHVKPMSYEHSCQALHIDKAVRKNFVNFSLVGGIPRYWKFLRENPDSITAANELFFDKHALLSEEPDRLLKDEAIEGNVARSVLEAIGRGARRPVEIAARLGMQQNTLSKTFQLLIQTSLVQRRVPFGESPKSSKKGIYVIQEPCLRFWYEVFSPHRSRWSLYPHEKQRRLIEEHTSHILEDIWRQQFVGAESYWESSIAEFDCVRYADEKLKTVIVSEVKWPRVSVAERKSLKRQIEEKFHACALSKSFRLADVEIISFEDFAQKSLTNPTPAPFS